MTDYTLIPYITPYLKDLEKILFEHRGHTIITILRNHDFEATCTTCAKRLLLRPILVRRIPGQNTPSHELPPTQTTPD